MILLLQELMRNSKRSDRDLAKKLEVSQPTLTRMRKKLEQEGYILDYTAIPNMTKLGFEIVAFTFVNIDRFDSETGQLNVAASEIAHKWIDHNPKILFGAGGEGLEGKNCMMVTVHHDFTDFTDFISDFRSKWSTSIKDIDTFLVSLKGKMPKPFTLRNLEIANP